MFAIQYKSPGVTPFATQLRKLGFASLVFFTAKGLLWLSLPWLLAQWL